MHLPNSVADRAVAPPSVSIIIIGRIIGDTWKLNRASVPRGWTRLRNRPGRRFVSGSIREQWRSLNKLWPPLDAARSSTGSGKLPRVDRPDSGRFARRRFVCKCSPDGPAEITRFEPVIASTERVAFTRFREPSRSIEMECSCSLIFCRLIRSLKK